MNYEISPEPSPAERAAILAALAAEEGHPLDPSPWAEAGLSERDPPADPEP
jgi:hypothetical protein